MLRWLRYRATTVAGVLVVAALLVGVVALTRVDPEAIAGRGLVDALPRIYWPTIAVPVVVLVWALRRSTQATVLLVLVVTTLAVLLHAAANIAEDVARFPVAFLHAGFADYIGQTGQTLPQLDARFSWPGFFSAAGALTELAGFDASTAWLRWAPIAMVLAYLPAVYVLFRALSEGWRAAWLAVVVFIFANWVGQDYFAPQSVNLLLYLSVMALVLTYFRRRDPGWITRLTAPVTSRIPKISGWLGRSRDRADLPLSAPARIWLLAVLLLVFTAMAASHQLTPILLSATLCGLAFVGRLRPWLLGVAAGLIALAWISFGAEAFWVGHIDEIFGGVGEVGNVIDQGVQNRVVGSPEHLDIARVRILFTLAIWGLASLGFLRRWRSAGSIDLATAVLFATPMMMIAAQSYGGEGLLRVFLFSLAGAGLLVARLFIPVRVLGRWSAAALAAVLLALTPGFMLAKYGNESFERVTALELEAIDVAYDVAPQGSMIAGITTYMPWRYRDVADHTYAGLLDVGLDDEAKLRELIETIPTEIVLVVTRGGIAFAHENANTTPEQIDAVLARLESQAGFKEVYANPDGAVYVRPAPGSTPAQAAAATAPVAGPVAAGLTATGATAAGSTAARSTAGEASGG